MFITLHRTPKINVFYDEHSKVVREEEPMPDITINPNYIVDLVAYDEYTYVELITGSSFTVKESIDGIKRMIDTGICSTHRTVMY